MGADVKHLIFGGLLALCLSQSAHAGTVYVRDSMGGRVVDFAARAEIYAERGDMVVIDGRCASACILYLHSDFGLKFCATRRAWLGLHMPRMTNRRGELIPDTKGARFGAIRYILDGLPDGLKEAFPVEDLPDVYAGASDRDLIWVKGVEAQKAIGACHE